jgi:hypothetical protein
MINRGLKNDANIFRKKVDMNIEEIHTQYDVNINAFHSKKSEIFILENKENRKEEQKEIYFIIYSLNT